MEELSHIFEGVNDPSKSNATRHDLQEMLMIGLLCVLCGGEGCCDMALFGRSKERFLRRFMTLEHGIPSHDAFSDLFNALDPENFQQVMQRLVEDLAQGLEGVIAIEPAPAQAGGKALRRSFRRACGSISAASGAGLWLGKPVCSRADRGCRQVQRDHRDAAALTPSGHPGPDHYRRCHAHPARDGERCRQSRWGLCAGPQGQSGCAPRAPEAVSG